jgi:2-polyprenyl-3-methyl-5-hydroxy-6-metoxy-1,4-benzoquinol methylase
MKRPLSRFLQALRWRFGKGWSMLDFQGRYRAKESDAWGYLSDARHLKRRDRIFSHLPNLAGKKVLEIGCAEGFITERLIAQSATVVACDLSEQAVARARKHCNNSENATFVTSDIRQDIPGQHFDICIASDVLYYLSETENRALAKRLADHMQQDGVLLFANEWNRNYRNLTHPQRTITVFESVGIWNVLEVDTQEEGEIAMHVVALLKRK